MMNSGQINGYGLNSTAVAGNNATLTGGFVSACALVALLVSSAVLSGGIYNLPSTGGSVSRSLDGGTDSGNSVGGKQFKTANLQQGIHSTGIVGSNLGIAMGLNGGTYSSSSYGGQVVTHVRLQMADTVGTTSQVNGLLRYSAGLFSGITSTSFVSSNIVGSTVLVAGGLHSSSQLSGDLLNGRILAGGASSNCLLSGGYLINGCFQDGIVSWSSTGKGLHISPILYDGILQVSTVGSPVLRLGANLSNGMGSNTLFTAQILLSPNSNYGVDSDSWLFAGMRKSVVLTGGFGQTSVADSVALKATQKLTSGIASTNALDALLVSSPHLNSGSSSNSQLNGNQVVGAKLQGYVSSVNQVDSVLVASMQMLGGFVNTSVLAGDLYLFLKLQGGLSSEQTMNAELISSPHLDDGIGCASQLLGNLKINAFLQNGINSSHILGGNLLASPFLQGGVGSVCVGSGFLKADAKLSDGIYKSSGLNANLLTVSKLTGGIASNKTVGGDIVQGFKDPLLNTWALSIVSATQILSIETPTKDV